MKLLIILASLVFFGSRAVSQTSIQLIIKKAGDHKIEKVDFLA